MMKDPGTFAVTCAGSIIMAFPLLVLILCSIAYGFNVAALITVMIIEFIFVLIVLFWVPLYVDIIDDDVIVKYVARVSKICSVNDVVHARYIESVSPAYLFCAGIGNRGFFGVAAECMEIKGIGHCYFYSRRSRDLVLLVLKDGRKYLVAPRDVEEFLNKLKMKNPYVICEHSGS